ncbi:PREDICTED: uncharacterized protein LOC104808800 [Tarenaya hassleriana]|uniref:uncharacterized protein LOC104808800 n=1 Tax=Tarenaya hassleriana TaxID=28532 RepID=UPI00053C9F4F|nr:PREDICTED: uncharacterized protein LOC104808800 [Tarenaya hassleriana]
MSRCYPFPPPGYEKKIVIDHVDVLSKEKHTEKKHKKGKDREKKDGKVKKDKDRSKEKGKERKDRREKHHGKKDRKEKGKDIVKNRVTSNDKKKPEVHLNSVNGATANSNGLQTENHNSENPNVAKEVVRRIRAEGQANGDQIAHKNTAADEGTFNGVINSCNLSGLPKRMVEKENRALGGSVLQKVMFVDQAEAQVHIKTNGRNGCISPRPNQIGNSRQVDDSMVHGTVDLSHLQDLTDIMVEKAKNGLGGQNFQKIGLVNHAKVRVHTRIDDGNVCFVPDPNGKGKDIQVDGRVVNGATDSSHLQVLPKRNWAEDKNGSRGQIVQKSGLVDQVKVQIHTRTDDGNVCIVSESNGKEKGTQVNGRAVNDKMDSSHLRVSVQRKEKNGFGGQIIQKIRLVDQEKFQINSRTDDGNDCFHPKPNGKEKITHVAVNGGEYIEEAMNAKNVVAKPSEATNVRIDSEGTGKSKYTPESNYKLDRHESKDRASKSELKDEAGDKEKIREEKSKEKGELSNGQSKGIITGQMLAGDGDLGKRKELEINGFLHDSGSRPHKLRRPVSSSPTEKHETDSDVVGLKNGLISSKSPLPAAMEASTRPPHEDSVILDRILSIPEMDRTPGLDDQEWLFCNRESVKILHHELNSSERQMVWSHGTRIESVGMFALPYVVPH